MTTTTQDAPDYAAIKARQNAAWASGDYARIGTTLQLTGELLAEAMDLAPGARVLDVAAGNGNATLAFARRWCTVMSTDYVEALLARGRARAEAEGLEIGSQVADAEALPFPDASFDAVVSTFGVMFAPDQATAAREMLRVCRPGGRIGMANWMPEGFIGQLFRTLGRHVPPPAGVKSPALWGSRPWLEEHFAGAAGILVNDRSFVLRYRSADHFIGVFRTWYGPVHKAFLALDAAGQAALAEDLRGLVGRFNTATDGTMRVPSDYAEVVVARG
ncbi:class I SAM-dependent methyltransferase [Dankookia rubra]|uniref:Class I SAM-dependent methyltransferase n=1 Tax=Dankookia rubra TaxID=1442381 RepID=A0A4R5QJF3_9PROT|nr:class I SAM-dependent methyltransferase [Dankookia rubra]TDH63534.1 class I SAM-dependent methyltransferase [Dankookia rubra]